MLRIFWIASSNYVTEAINSCKSVRRFYPNNSVEFWIFSTQKPVPEHPFDFWITAPQSHDCYWFLESVRLMNIAVREFYNGDKVIYLDTDTYVCDNLDDIFWGLERFDFLGAQAPGRKTAPVVKLIPDAFVEYNIGVQGILVSDNMRSFLRAWLNQYQTHQDIYRNNDQAPLRETIWNYSGSLKFGTLPIEFNFRFGMGGQIREKVRVLHGRSNNYEALEKKVNPGGRTIRAWKPGELK